MAVEISLVCDESADAYSVQLLSIVISVVFGLYILFDAVLGAFTVGAKAYQLLTVDRKPEPSKPDPDFEPRSFD